jgi:hypothetical protein
MNKNTTHDYPNTRRSFIDSQSIKKDDHNARLIQMSWWPFKKKEKVLQEEPHIKGTRLWLQDLREISEKNFDNSAEGQRLIRQMQVEWTDAYQKGEVAEQLLSGLDRRAFRLLRADSEEWLKWLDNEDFWLPGWGVESRE